jgi:hypothetical protein
MRLRPISILFDSPIWAVGSPPPEVTAYRQAWDMLNAYKLAAELGNPTPHFPPGSSRWGAKRLRRCRNTKKGSP